jgi:hypothetical protein
VAFAVLVNDVPTGTGKKARALGDEIASAIVLWSAAQPVSTEAPAASLAAH